MRNNEIFCFFWSNFSCIGNKIETVAASLVAKVSKINNGLVVGTRTCYS